MELFLSAEEARIVGALMEKEITTPDYYPMSLNGLVNACNQKSCREPVMAFDESSAGFHLDILRDEKRLVAMVSSAASRGVKYKQRLTEAFFFTPPERAILCELLLRGPQTPGELRNRAERMHPFTSLDEVNAALKELETRADGPWVVLLPKMPGHKEARYAHLLSGTPSMDAETATAPEAVTAASPVARIVQLEQDVQELRTAMDKLTAAFDQFRTQLGG